MVVRVLSGTMTGSVGKGKHPIHWVGIHGQENFGGRECVKLLLHSELYNSYEVDTRVN